MDHATALDKELFDDLMKKAADTIERLNKERDAALAEVERLTKGNDAGRELMRQAWHEFNAIRARDGAPVGVSEEWWSQMTEELGKLLGDEAKPWMSDAAQALLAPSHAEICEVQDRVTKAELERDEARAEVERLKCEIGELSGKWAGDMAADLLSGTSTVED